jgi:flavin-dependent dehydrogenase
VRSSYIAVSKGGYYSHALQQHLEMASPINTPEKPDPGKLDADVIVAGGGPAGSTAATFLARLGHRVLLLEKSRHPRFHIGESLLPMNLPILERLGVLEQVEKLGVRKGAADFPASNPRGFYSFDFARSLPGSPDHAFQVPRAQFDELLFRHAAAAGVDAREAAEVDEVRLSDQGASVQVRDANGSRSTMHARYFLDATGRDTLLGDRLRLKHSHPRHRSAALFAHFEGVERREGEHAGNISVYRLPSSLPSAWIWLIPLPDGLTSIGIVCLPQLLKTRTGDRQSFFLELLRSVPELAARMRLARLSGELHASGNYSYTCDRFHGPRWLMVGDSAAFIDPVFSSGVFLAMHGAERAAVLVDAVLAGASESPLQRAYEREMRAGMRQFSWFIERFTSPALAWLFANPRNNLRLEEALISLLAGRVFNARSIARRLVLFKVIYYVTSLRLWRQTLRHRRELRACSP